MESGFESMCGSGRGLEKRGMRREGIRVGEGWVEFMKEKV